MEHMKKTNFSCQKCGTSQAIEALGVVVVPPKCKRCGLKMKQVEHSKQALR